MICTFCQNNFERAYRRSAARKAAPQYCSKKCIGQHRSAQAKASFASNFWKRVGPPNETGCREWTGRKMKMYGVVGVGNRPHLTHRIAYRLALGVDPGSLCVCHSCDNPPCCEPAHLWLGTHKENMVDRDKKRRCNPPSFLGEKHPAARLTDADILAIRGSPDSNNALAARFGVGAANIRRIRLYETWKHV